MKIQLMAEEMVFNGNLGAPGDTVQGSAQHAWQEEHL